MCIIKQQTSPCGIGISVFKAVLTPENILLETEIKHFSIFTCGFTVSVGLGEDVLRKEN